LSDYAGNNPIIKLVSLFNSIKEKKAAEEKKIMELRELGDEMYRKGTINGIDLFLKNDEDGCYARATVIAGELEKQGFEVTDYTYVEKPVLPNVVRAELAAGRDPSKVPDYDAEGNSNRFAFHVAATVIIGKKKYVVDPFYHKSWLSISEQSDWYEIQFPKGEKTTQAAHDSEGNLIGPYAMNYWKNESNYKGSLSINEYAKGWLKNYDLVKKRNEKTDKKSDPHIWSGE